MRKTIVTGIFLAALGMSAGNLCLAAETHKSDDKKGLSIEDVGRGLKSAEQNIEKEIPKIGPAIVDTFKKVTGKSSTKPADDKSKPEK